VQKGTRTRNYTRGGTTTESNDAEQDRYRTNALGVKVDITPKPLFVSRKTDPASHAKGGEEESKADKPAAESKNKPKEVTESQQSGTSSLLETSEDEEQKKKDAAKAKGAHKFEAHELA